MLARSLYMVDPLVVFVGTLAGWQQQYSYLDQRSGENATLPVYMCR